MEDSEKKIKKLKMLSIKRSQLRITISNLRKQKSKTDNEIDELIQQISNEV